AGAALALGSLEFRPRLLPAAHEGLVPLVVPEHPASFDGLLKTAHERLEQLSWPGSDLHSSNTRFPREFPVPMRLLNDSARWELQGPTSDAGGRRPFSGASPPLGPPVQSSPARTYSESHHRPQGRHAVR